MKKLNFFQKLFLKPAAQKIEDFIASEKPLIESKLIAKLEAMNITGLTPEQITATVDSLIDILVEDIDAIIDGEVAAQTSN